MNKLIEKAVEEARKTMNNNIGGPFGALITDENNNIISIASNTVLRDHDPTAHAEVNAIRKAGKVLKTHDLSNCKLYTTSYPCPLCLSAIIWSNIKQIYYGAEVEDVAKIGFRDDYIYNFIKKSNKNSKILKIEKVESKESIDLLKEYKKKNKEMY